MFSPAEVTRRIGKQSKDAVFPDEVVSSGPWAREFVALGRAYGFGYCLLTSFPTADSPEFSSNLMLTNWPDELRLEYQAAESFAGCHLVRRMKSSILPIYSVENLLLNPAPTSETFRLANAFIGLGLSGHLYFCLSDRNQTRYLLVFSGRDIPLSRDAIALIQLTAMELLDAGVDTLMPRHGPREKLSAREIECLRWSAAGKSSDEIAIILDISSHTVVSYLKSAMRKLEAVNRMQAVARACRFRLL